MLHLFQSIGYEIGVAHCNFQLRGKDSDDDEQFIENHCRVHQIPFFVNRFETNNYAIQNGISIQMAARDLRYEWFEEVRKKEQFDFIATAHHLNDSIETIIFNLTNGRGVEGLTGIPVKNEKIIRPLLFASRHEIESYAAENQIIWREDISNQKDDYKRNFIRLEIIPRLKVLNPALEEAVSKSIKKNKGSLELERRGLTFFESENVKKDGNRISIPIRAIEEFDNRDSALYLLVKQFGFSIEQCTQLVASLHGQSGKSFYSDSHQLVIDRNGLIVSPIAVVQQPILIEEHQQESFFNGSRIELKITEDTSFGSDFISIDADKLTYPLLWRNWQEADFFYPLGMKNKKKVSDFLIDNKVSIADKNHVSVIESDGEIFWVVGHRISDHFKITPDTKRAVRFTLTRHFI
jgi:tRNA(Ile)-lysidine synthase